MTDEKVSAPLATFGQVEIQFRKDGYPGQFLKDLGEVLTWTRDGGDPLLLTFSFDKPNPAAYVGKIAGILSSGGYGSIVGPRD